MRIDDPLLPTPLPNGSFWPQSEPDMFHGISVSDLCFFSRAYKKSDWSCSVSQSTPASIAEQLIRWAADDAELETKDRHLRLQPPTSGFLCRSRNVAQGLMTFVRLEQSSIWNSAGTFGKTEKTPSRALFRVHLGVAGGTSSISTYLGSSRLMVSLFPLSMKRLHVYLMASHVSADSRSRRALHQLVCTDEDVTFPDTVSLTLVQQLLLPSRPSLKSPKK